MGLLDEVEPLVVLDEVVELVEPVDPVLPVAEVEPVVAPLDEVASGVVVPVDEVEVVVPPEDDVPLGGVDAPPVEEPEAGGLGVGSLAAVPPEADELSVGAGSGAGLGWVLGVLGVAGSSGLAGGWSAAADPPLSAVVAGAALSLPASAPPEAGSGKPSVRIAVLPKADVAAAAAAACSAALVEALGWLAAAEGVDAAPAEVLGDGAVVVAAGRWLVASLVCPSLERSRAEAARRPAAA